MYLRIQSIVPYLLFNGSVKLYYDKVIILQLNRNSSLSRSDSVGRGIEYYKVTTPLVSLHIKTKISR